MAFLVALGSQMLLKREFNAHWSDYFIHIVDTSIATFAS